MIKKRKITALKALEKQKEKLLNEDYYKDWTWIAQTADIVKKYIGKDSALYTSITQFSFSVTYYGGVRDNSMADLIAKQREALRYINNCIEYVELNDVKEEPKINFIQKLSDRVVWAILVAIMSLSFSAGIFTKSIQIDKKKISLERDVENLKKQVEDYKLIISNNQKND